MKRVKFEASLPLSRVTLVQTLMAVLFLCLLFMSLEVPLIFKSRDGHGSVPVHGDGSLSDALPRTLNFERNRQLTGKDAMNRLMKDPDAPGVLHQTPERRKLSGLFSNETVFDATDSTADEFSVLHKAAKEAWLAGKKIWDELESGKIQLDQNNNTSADNRTERCPNWIALSGSQFSARNRIMEIPCGLTLGSHITVVGKPRWGHPEKNSKISLVKEGAEAVTVSQFLMELQGLKTVDGEDPPRILHFNPRLKGDWSGRPVIEQNTCYRMQWGNALRCEGWNSRADEETGISLSLLFFAFVVDGLNELLMLLAFIVI